MRSKSAWVLGGAALVIEVAAVVAAMGLSGGGTMRAATVVASSSASPGVPSYGNLVPVSASPSASEKPSVIKKSSVIKKKAASKHRSSPATATRTPSAGNSPPPDSSAAANESLAPTKSAASGVSAASGRVSARQPVGWWALNDDDPAETARDSMGRNVATGTNITWCTSGGGNCATFNGESSAFTTSHSVLDTAPGSSFTVSANVYLSAITGFETIVSQDGADDSGFYLQYSGTNRRWAFARVTGDTDASPAGIRALSTSTPELSTWTHLVGVYDASDNHLRLYVNGVLEGTATDSSPFAATGGLAIGRGQFDGHPADWFNGAANQVKVYNQALTTAQVDNI
jgi:Concanavalin A-like lectin/glucanases superfamily